MNAHDVTIYDDGSELIIRSPFEAKDCIKGLPGTRWSSEQKAWIAPRWLLRELVARFRTYGYHVDVINGRHQTEARPSATPMSWAASMFAGIPARLVQPVYRALAKVLHPDSGGDLEAMKALTRAYDNRGGT